MSIAADFWTLTVTDTINSLILIATIAAIIYGPIKAVEISRTLDRERDSEARKRRIAEALMRTRKVYMHPDHVGALNQVQLEFANDHKVLDAYKSYISNLYDNTPNPGTDLQIFLSRRQSLFFELLHQIGVIIGVAIDKHDLDHLSYVPIGWATDEEEARVFRRALIALLEGKKPLYTSSFSAAPAAFNPFPPPPPHH